MDLLRLNDLLELHFGNRVLLPLGEQPRARYVNSELLLKLRAEFGECCFFGLGDHDIRPDRRRRAVDAELACVPITRHDQLERA